MPQLSRRTHAFDISINLARIDAVASRCLHWRARKPTPGVAAPANALAAVMLMLIACFAPHAQAQNRGQNATRDAADNALHIDRRANGRTLTITDDQLRGRTLVVTASNVTLDLAGVELDGPGQPGQPATFFTGTGIRVENAENVTIRNATARGFRIGLEANSVANLVLEDCDFSDNYHDPAHGWGDGERVGGIILTDVSGGSMTDTKAQRNWNGLDLLRTNDFTVRDSNLSHCSNVGLKLDQASRNRFIDNDISYGIRISPGEVHARDSTGVLLESGSNDNLFENNDMTHGGNGFFIRVLNGWCSTGNVMKGNDASYANNNGFESWSPGNTYIDNVANYCSYGFWLGGSDQTVLRGNTAAFNGTPQGHQNAPEPDFGHGGIVIVNGPGSNTVIEGNHVHDNNGGGIVFRGDRVSRGEKWPFFHVLVQNNTIENNRYGVFTAFADWVRLSGNAFKGNEQDVAAEAVTDLTRVDDMPDDAVAPVAGIGVDAILDGAGTGMTRRDREVHTRVGEVLRFTAQVDGGTATTNTWKIVAGDWDSFKVEKQGGNIEHAFNAPGFYRVGLMAVADSGLAALDWLHVYVSEAGGETRMTEGDVSAWDVEARGESKLSADDVAIVGERSARFNLTDHRGMPYALVLEPSQGFDLGDASTLSFWFKTENANIAGFRGPTPTIRLGQGERTMTYLPTRHGVPRHLLIDPPYSEARQGWMRIAVDLAGSDTWSRYETVEGEVPPYVDPATDLAFVTHQTNFATQDDTALVSDGQTLYLASLEGNRFVQSRDDGKSWQPMPGPQDTLGRTWPGWRNGMLAYAADLGPRGSLLIRHVVPEQNQFGFNPARLARFDLAKRQWSWLSADISMNLGSAVVGDYLYGIARARAGDYGGPLTRVKLSDPGELEERSVIGNVVGNSAFWFGSVAQLVEHDGMLYGIKNDWASPQPDNRDEIGDRLFVIEPADYAPSKFLGGNYDGQRRWEARTTPSRDLGPLPFEVGNGASLAALPANWGGVVGRKGGLFILAGSSPADHEGNGSPSKHYAVYDVASGKMTKGTLPADTATGTSVVFHRHGSNGEEGAGKLIINRGGMNFPSSNQQVWEVSPADAEMRRAAGGPRETFDFGRVERIEVQMQSNGGRPVTLWVDGLRWE